MTEERAGETAEVQDASGVEPEVEEMDDEALDRYLEDTPGEPESEDAEGDKPSDPTPPDEPAEGEPVPQESTDPLAEMREELERLKKQVGDKERFIQDRNREVGELRKQLREEADKLREGVPDLFVDDPGKAIENLLSAREREQRAASLEMEAVWEDNKAKVMEFEPGFDSRVDEIVEIAKSDGVPEDAIRAFKNNPYATSPQLLRVLLKRADDAKELKTLRDSLAKEKQEKESVADRIAAAASRTSGVTGKTPGATHSADRFKNLTEDEIDSLPDSELDALLEREG